MDLIQDKLTTDEGIDIFYCKLIPENPKAIVLLLHGYGNHYLQMEPLFEPLYNSCFGIYAYDHRGHGRSHSPRGNLYRFEYFLSDMNYVLKYIKSNHPEINLYTIGHSMGGLISFVYATLNEHILKGQIFLAPALGAPCGTRFIPNCFFSAAKKHFSRLKIHPIITRPASRNKSYIRKLAADPLCLKYSTMGFYCEFLYRGINMAIKNSSQYTLPCLILHGKRDKIIPYKHSIYICENIRSKDKTLKLFQNVYHEMLFEPEKDNLINEILEWLDKRTSREI